MPLDESDRRQIEALIEERVEPIRIQRGELTALQTEVAHLVRAVEGQSALIEANSRSIAELAACQRRTEASIDRLERVTEEQGKRFEEQGKRIEEQGQRIDEMGNRIDRLIETMDRGFREVRREVEAVDRGLGETRREIGALTEAHGIDLEDVGRYVVPFYLRIEEGYEVGELEEGRLAVDGEEFEFDLYGPVSRGQERRTVVGEVKSRVHPGEMEALIARNARIAASLPHPILSVHFPRRIHPRALDRAREAGFVVVPWDYQYQRRPA